MRVRSFRLRIALSSALVSGVVLVVFEMVAWGVLYRLGKLGVDREVRDLVLRQVRHGVQPGPYWRAREASGEETRSYRAEEILLIQHAWGAVAYRSENWPDGLDLTALGLVDSGAEPVVSPAASNMSRSGPPGRPGLGGRPGPPELEEAAAPYVRVFTQTVGGRDWRLGVAETRGVAVAVGVGLDGLARDMEKMRNAFLLALPLGLVLVAGGAVVLSGRALQSVRTLSEAVEGITATGLDRRIAPEQVDSEFDSLIRVFNAMLDRLEASFGQAVRFSADAAHELKTPLTILRGRIEQALSDAAPDSQNERDLTELLEEVHRLTSIIEALLLLSRADAGRLQIGHERVDLREIVDEIADETRSLAPDLDVEVELDGDGVVCGDGRLIAMAVGNLASNASKYNCDGGRIEFKLGRAGEMVRVSVANTGPAIPEEECDRVFDRFRRLDPARSREVGGVGLGLSLAREVVRAHGGDLRLAPRDGEMNLFLLDLPCVDAG